MRDARASRFFWQDPSCLSERIWYHALPVLINRGVSNLGSRGAGKQRWDFCFSDDQLHVRQRFFHGHGPLLHAGCGFALWFHIAQSLRFDGTAATPAFRSFTLANRTCTAGLLHTGQNPHGDHSILCRQGSCTVGLTHNEFVPITHHGKLRALKRKALSRTFVLLRELVVL